MSAPIPSEFLCPISMGLMREPVVGPDGHTYDRQAIEAWLVTNPISPLTREHMTASQLKPNYSLRAALDRFLSAQAQAQAPQQQDAPQEPPTEIQMPQTVVLAVLDSSGSMDENATPPSDQNKEGLVFTRMDLLKHSMRTVAALCHNVPSTALGIISFDSSARLLMPTQSMNDIGLAAANASIDRLSSGGATNIWDGLRLALREAENVRQRIPGAKIDILLLTDGEPTASLSPPRGIVSTLRDAFLNAHSTTISSFGFGYNLDSQLLADICEIGHGIYGYIPDCSMVGTVFINFCAHILTQDKCPPRNPEPAIDAVLTVLKGMTKDVRLVGSNPFTQVQEWLRTHADTSTPANPIYQALLDDIEHTDDHKGQLMKALSRPDWFNSWGYNHILAYRRALEKEVCINFKDAALQCFAYDAFRELQTEGDKLFAALPAPVPRGHTAASFAATNFSMATFNTADGGCFAGHCIVDMANGVKKRVDECVKGDVLSNGSVIRCVVKRRVAREVKMVEMPGGLLITPWHPVRPGAESTWRFPCLWLNKVDLVKINAFYDFVLDAQDPSRHFATINGLDVVTLGHGFKGEVVEHSYYGTNAVIVDMMEEPGWEEGLVKLG